ncbi:uncharacterized protein [Rutidosis leptorrhynchoides]|uniref:uncharacterized protein n=1 Tax=Rutidosis leptorrhynchoides TaxID=125765 RepID=UPI003A99EC88
MADYLAETAADIPVIYDSELLLAPSPELWELYNNGAASSEGAGAGLILTGPHQQEHTYELMFNFKMTNNEAEYEALLAGMHIARELGVKKLQAYVDSQLVANQINGTFDANEKSMQSYLALVHSLADIFIDFRISQIPRSQNKQADVLSKLVALTFNHLEKKLLVEQVFKKSTKPEVTVASVEEEEATWMTDIIEFLRTGSLPENEKEAMKIRVKAPNYELMYADTAERIRVCQECQLHAPVSRALQHPMIPITSPWPFCNWAIDIVGPFLKGAGNAEYLVVAIDFFTKGVEAKPLRTITSKRIRDFFWESIVCRFGIPNKIVSDNGTQFEGNPFRSWSQDLNIKQRFTFVAHPQANGQCEVTNRDIVHTIKASLVYGSEAVIPAEIIVPTERMLSYSEEGNDEKLRTNLDYMEERREMAAIREAANKQRIAKYYDKRVRARSYKVGDLVWHDNQASRAQNTGKLGPNWEGPYKVIGISNTGTYKLAELKGNPIKQSWHATALNKCYM